MGRGERESGVKSSIDRRFAASTRRVSQNRDLGYILITLSKPCSDSSAAVTFVCAGLDSYMNPFEVKYSTMAATDWVTSSSFVLRWISGFSGASYGAETPVNS